MRAFDAAGPRPEHGHREVRPIVVRANRRKAIVQIEACSSRTLMPTKAPLPQQHDQ